MTQETPDQMVTISLPLSAVNYLIQAIAKRPYDEVNGLINAITAQASASLEQQAKDAKLAARAAGAEADTKVRGKPGRKAKAETVADDVSQTDTPAADTPAADTDEPAVDPTA